MGGLIKRIEGGECFRSRGGFACSALAGLTKSEKGLRRHVTNLARVGVGVGYKDGGAKPDISTTEHFKTALLAAKGIAYIDPASGGTSGIYIAGLIDKLGIGDQVRAKSVLVKGGYSAERIISGEAEIAIQQISEILPVRGVAYAGPLPADIQSFTTYTAAMASGSAHAAAARIFVDLIRSPAGAAIIETKGMEPAP